MPRSSVLLLALLGSVATEAFVPSSSPLGASRRAAAAVTRRDMVGNVNLDFYPGLRGLFDMGNIILDEVRAGSQEANQEISEMAGWVKEKVSLPQAEQQQAAAVMANPVHPVFGELVKDLTYKKIYCTSVQKLANVPIWEKQRIYRAERAQLLAQDIKAKLKQGKPLTLPSIITIYEFGEEHGLLDGQHRYVLCGVVGGGGGGWASFVSTFFLSLSHSLIAASSADVRPSS